MSHPSSRRALRRHHRARVIRNRVRQAVACLGVDPADIGAAWRGSLADVDTLRRCSCHLCRAWPTPRRRPPGGWWDTDLVDRIPRAGSGRRVAAGG